MTFLKLNNNAIKESKYFLYCKFSNVFYETILDINQLCIIPKQEIWLQILLITLRTTIIYCYKVQKAESPNDTEL